jgi:hypothetical protein
MLSESALYTSVCLDVVHLALQVALQDTLHLSLQLSPVPLPICVEGHGETFA